MAEGKPAYGTVRKQLARRIGDAVPEPSALDSVINDLKSAAEVPAIIKTEKVLVPDQTTIAENRELKRRIIDPPDDCSQTAPAIRGSLAA